MEEWPHFQEREVMTSWNRLKGRCKQDAVCCGFLWSLNKITFSHAFLWKQNKSSCIFIGSKTVPVSYRSTCDSVSHFIALCLLLLGDGDTLKQYYTPGWCFTGAGRGQGESVGFQTHIFTTFGILRISLAVEVCISHTSSCFLCSVGRHRWSLSKFH